VREWVSLSFEHDSIIFETLLLTISPHLPTLGTPMILGVAFLDTLSLGSQLWAREVQTLYLNNTIVHVSYKSLCLWRIVINGLLQPQTTNKRDRSFGT
jgi:hypothetical protein